MRSSVRSTLSTAAAAVSAKASSLSTTLAASLANKHRNAYLEATYHISLAEYDAMDAAQKGLCLICGKPPHGRIKLLVVDHNHASGKVRGLLCSECNTALGLFYDDPKNLQAAINYLASVGNYAEVERHDDRPPLLPLPPVPLSQGKPPQGRENLVRKSGGPLHDRKDS